MPFTFKLSMRLALMKSAGTLALLAALASCELPGKLSGPQTRYIVSTMFVVPDAITLQPAEIRQFATYGRTQRGDSVPIVVTWQALGGVMSSDGAYSAGIQDGDFAATATLVPPDAIGGPSGAAQLQRTVVMHIRGLAQIVVVPQNVSLSTGGTQQFAAYGRLSNGDSVAVSVTWAASGGAVSSSGLYTTGSAPGGYVVGASASGLTGSAIVTASGVPVASVVVAPTTANLSVGGTAQLSATPKDAAGTVLTGRSVTWTSSNAAVATVSAAGLVTGVAAGSATITATSEGISATAAMSVANLPVAAVVVSPATPNVYVGGAVQLTATPKDANGIPLSGRVVTWTSSNPAIATVSATGLVTGVAVGVVTITATSEGQSGTAAVTISNVPVASVVVSPTTVSLSVGGTAQLSATPKDAAGTVLTGRAVTWTSSNAAVATVSAAGLVTAIAAGSATITATSEGISATAAMSVANLPVAAVVVSPVTAVVFAGSTVQLTATLKDASGNVLTGRLVTWTSSNPAIATVSAAGLVTGVAAGAATITATSEGKTGSAAVTVNLVPVASVTVSPATASTGVGQGVLLMTTLRDASGNVLTGRSIAWASSAPAVAAVSNGLVTGVAAGSATITATSEGQSGAAAITVTAPPSGGIWSNEPAGLTVFSDYGFTDPIPAVNDGPVGHGWRIVNPDAGQPLVAGHAESLVDPTAPLGPNVANYVYPVGMRDGWAPARMYYTGFSATEVYAGFLWKPSNPWQTDGSGVNKIAFLYGGPSGAIYISMNWNGSVYHLRVEDEINSPTNNYDPNVTLTPITLGQWHKVEWHASTTGGLKFWLDGVLQGSYPALRWANPFFMYELGPTWGGNGGDVKRTLDSYWYNHVHLSGR